MTTWKENELTVLQEYLATKEGPITRDDHTIIQQRLPHRSIAAIKKKCQETKAATNNPAAQAERRQRASRWCNEEVERLVEAYTSREETQVTARLKAIQHMFPGRSVKALASKLKTEHPNIYYMKAGPLTDPEDNTSLHNEANEDENSTNNKDDHIVAENQEGNPHEVSAQEERPPNRDNTSTNNQIVTTENAHEVSTQERKQANTNESGENNQNEPIRENRMKKIEENLENNDDLLVNDQELQNLSTMFEKIYKNTERKIADIQNTTETEVEKRKQIKTCIYTAGQLLRTMIFGKNNEKTPDYVPTERKIKQLKENKEIAEQIRQINGEKLNKKQYTLIKIMKKWRTTPTQYINTAEERIKSLEIQLEKQKQRKDDVEEKTPILDKWLKKLQRYSKNNNYQEQPEQLKLAKLIKTVLQKSPPWKAPGEDGIPTYLYKILPAANRYLNQHMQRIFSGATSINEADTRATVILIHKKGDPENPSNYRPIALLNNDYKMLTATITLMLKENLPKWAIPPEQLARENVWGTMQGMMIDKATTQIARMRNRTNYSTWYDFTKAYDSINHEQLKRMMNTLPLPRIVRQVLRQAVGLWSIRVKAGKGLSKPIYVKRGVYQGDTISPMLFVLITASILVHLREDPEINRLTKGKHVIMAFMDDIKVHTPTKEGSRIMTEELRRGAQELGLRLNENKCGLYSRDQEGEVIDQDPPFLPEIREAYTYLGIEQLERDTQKNYENIQTKVKQKTEVIFSSELSTNQKVELYNSAIVSAAIYVLGNIYPDEKLATSLLKCKKMDDNIRKSLVQHNIKGKTTSNARVYLPTLKGGLGIRSIELETELQLVRKGVYLENHPDTKEALQKFQKLQAKGWRNPITDMGRVLEKYECTNIEVDMERDLKKLTQKIVKRVRERQIARIEVKWATHMHYPKRVVKEGNKITFPAYTSPFLDGWRLTLLQAAAEEQIHGLGAIPEYRRRCRRGCANDETAYHVATACPSNEFITRHDNLVYWILKAILGATGAPKPTTESLFFGKATLNAQYTNIKNQRNMTVIAGHPIITEYNLHHNKPDILVKLENPTEVIILEIAISHIQNYRDQEMLKHTRYAVNSVDNITNENATSISRKANLVTEVGNMHACSAELGIFVVGCYGEIITTEAHNKCIKLLKRLGLSDLDCKGLVNKCSYSAAVSTSTILMRRLQK
ncbi:unnamed protein product [Brassicogethes aeneus]|uniref:Reverse transcriptase domain-containing protein n=1 Tax=Brassicogethes aeneus TaxID=1431903 RepID=A0A9P0B758_BRAAE|nr:unnamed protein product [Brassicogethes aeneus]